jgi:hypothetical protein
MAERAPQASAWPSRYLVSLFGEGHYCPDSRLFGLTVAQRRKDQWSVHRGWRANLSDWVLDADGHWHPDDHDNPALRHTLAAALALARAHAPRIDYGGRSVLDVLARHETEGCPG